MNRLLRLLPEDCAQTSNFEFITLMFSKHLMENEAVCLIGTLFSMPGLRSFRGREMLELRNLLDMSNCVIEKIKLQKTFVRSLHEY